MMMKGCQIYRNAWNKNLCPYKCWGPPPHSRSSAFLHVLAHSRMKLGHSCSLSSFQQEHRQGCASVDFLFFLK